MRSTRWRHLRCTTPRSTGSAPRPCWHTSNQLGIPGMPPAPRAGCSSRRHIPSRSGRRRWRTRRRGMQPGLPLPSCNSTQPRTGSKQPSLPRSCSIRQGMPRSRLGRTNRTPLGKSRQGRRQGRCNRQHRNTQGCRRSTRSYRHREKPTLQDRNFCSTRRRCRRSPQTANLGLALDRTHGFGAGEKSRQRGEYIVCLCAMQLCMSV